MRDLSLNYSFSCFAVLGVSAKMNNMDVIEIILCLLGILIACRILFGNSEE